MQQQDNDAEAGTEQLGIWELGELMLQHWRLTTSVVFVCGTLALTAALLAEPRFRSEAVLNVVEDNMTASTLSTMLGNLGSVAQLAGLTSGTGTSTDDAVAVLESWSLAEAFIEQQGLLDDLAADSRSLLGRLTSFGSAPRGFSMQRAVKYFRDSILSVRRDKISGLVTVSIVWKRPDEAATWVNVYVLMADALMRERALGDSERSLSYLRKEFDSTSEVALRNAVANLVEAELKRRIFALARREYALQILDSGHAPDPRDKVYPRRAWILLAGLLAGVMLAALIVWFRTRIRSLARDE